jgi:hypothetical protein
MLSSVAGSRRRAPHAKPQISHAEPLFQIRDGQAKPFENLQRMTQ